MPRKISASTVTSANISASLRIATYIADADREVYWRVSASGLAGSATGYMPFLTTQFLGVGASHFSMPDTTASPGAGKTAIYFHTIPQVIQNTDIQSVYFVGSASDTSVAVTAEIWETGGASAISASNIASNAFAVGKFGASAIAASNIAGCAINNQNFALTAGSQVWDAAVRTITSATITLGASAISASTFAASAIDANAFSQNAADYLWSSSSRTLTQAAQTIASIVSGSTLTVHRGDSLSFSITNLGNISTRSKLWLTAKNNKSDADTSAILQFEETGGLLYFNAAIAASPTLGKITVTNAISGNITVTLDDVYSASLARVSGKFYDVQWLSTSGSIVTASEGEFNVDEDVTRAVS